MAARSERVLLIEPDADEYIQYFEKLHSRFAKEIAEVEGATPAESMETAEKELSALLPGGQATPDHVFGKLHLESGSVAGMIWYRRVGGSVDAFVYDLFVEPEFRGMGIGREALGIVEKTLKAEGCARVWLNVFSTNEAGLAFFRCLGYTVKSVYMSKELR